MTAFAGTQTEVEVAPNLGVKIIKVKLDDTADDTDTFTVDLTAYGCTNIDGVFGFIETTTGSVIVAENPTTAVSSGTLTGTVTGSTDNKARTYYIYAY